MSAKQISALCLAHKGRWTPSHIDMHTNYRNTKVFRLRFRYKFSFQNSIINLILPYIVPNKECQVILSNCKTSYCSISGSNRHRKSELLGDVMIVDCLIGSKNIEISPCILEFFPQIIINKMYMLVW